MIFRGAQIQRGVSGRCGLLPKRILSSNRAALPSSGVLAPAGRDPYTFRPHPIAVSQHVGHVADCNRRNPFQLT
jgi:hypothetical protein